jgi:hypothetical protein
VKTEVLPQKKLKGRFVIHISWCYLLVRLDSDESQ